MELHQRIKLARERKFEEPADAARAVGIPYSSLMHHEAGTRGIKDKGLRRYADIYKVRIEWLRYEDGPMTEEQSREIKAIVNELNDLPVAELARTLDLVRALRRHST